MMTQSTLFGTRSDSYTDGMLARRLARLGLAGAILAGVAGALPVRPGFVVGESMQPSLQPGQPFLYSRRGPGSVPFRRGDIVLLRMQGVPCVKRVFAVGGDGFWTVNSTPGDGLAKSLLDPGVPIRRWRKRYPLFHYRRLTVPRGSVFVVGEGPNSLDSRELGPVPVRDVLGRLLFTAPRPCRNLSGVLAWVDRPHGRAPS